MDLVYRTYSSLPHCVVKRIISIPQNQKHLQAQMREVIRLYPDASDMELYLRAIDRYYLPQSRWTIENWLNANIPTMDTLVRRARGIREEMRRNKRNPTLF
jgi:hypothetical protein